LGKGIIDFDGYSLIHSVGLIKREYGVSIITSPHVKILEIDFDNSSDRILKILIKVHGVRMKIINVYAPTNESKISSKELFYKNLQTILADSVIKCTCLIGGDFNATISTSTSFYPFVGNNNYEPETNINGSKLLEFALTKVKWQLFDTEKRTSELFLTLSHNYLKIYVSTYLLLFFSQKTHSVNMFIYF